MNLEEKRSYIEYLRLRYKRQSRKGKSEILDELCNTFSCHRKHALRLMRAKKLGRPKKSLKVGRKSKYQDYEFIQALRKSWLTTNKMCSKRLKSAIPEWLPYIEAEHGGFSSEVREKLLTISPPTIDRILKGYKQNKGTSSTRSGSLLKKEIPIQGNIWDMSQPGFMEADTVAHCGGSLYGEFVNSLTVTDIATTWTESRALWGKSVSIVLPHLYDIEKNLPFPLLGFDSDGGSEFINHAMKKYLENPLRDERVIFTRSRPYQKNDNAHVEQKNWSIARRYLGYERLDFIELAVLANNYLRDIVCPLLNHFHPSFKLRDKQQVKSRYKRFYDKPLTPYQRVMESAYIDESTKDMLKMEHLKLNPVYLTKQERVLRKKIDQKLKELLKLRKDNQYTPLQKSVDIALGLKSEYKGLSTPPPQCFKYRSKNPSFLEVLSHLV